MAKHKNSIIVFYQKSMQDMVDVALPRIINYAKRCKVDLIQDILPVNCKNPQMEKFFRCSVLNSHERYLFIDIDILIRNDAPNIFEIARKTSFCAYNEGATFMSNLKQLTEEIEVRWNTVAGIMKDCKLPQIEMQKIFSYKNPYYYFNSGVILLSQEHLGIYQGFTKAQKSSLFTTKITCPEQALINYCFIRNNPNLYSLPVCWNQMTYNRCSDYLDTAYFSHYAGMSFKNKLKEMKEDDLIWKNKNL